MQDVICQYRGGLLMPNSKEDLEALAEEYTNNQLIRCKTTRVSKALEPSVKQNNLLHACFELVAESTPNPNLNTKKKAKFGCKAALHFVYEDRMAIRPDGTIVFEYRSFSFEELRNMERLNIFQRGFEWAADAIGVSVPELVAEAKRRMGPRR